MKILKYVDLEELADTIESIILDELDATDYLDDDHPGVGFDSFGMVLSKNERRKLLKRVGKELIKRAKEA